MNSRKSLKTGINLKFCLLCLITIILTVLLCIAVFFNIFKRQVYADLETYAVFLEGPNYLKRLLELRDLLEEASQRVTLIHPDGVVLFDSNAGTSVMDNHNGRAEIKSARSNGEGMSVRKSKTLGTNTYYYATLLPDGNVLRVSIESDNVLKFFISMIPFILIMCVVVFGICYVMAYFLTKKIVEPIEEIIVDIEDTEGKIVYTELIPFSELIKEQHRSIQKQIFELEKSSKIRQDFTANVSHELKTPITVILGYAELMESGMAGASDVMRFSGEIRTSANRLLSQINDIIQLSELDSREQEPEREWFDLHELAGKCVEKLTIKAVKHGVRIFLETGKNALRDVMVYNNKSMIEEMLNNLCDNAIRYNKAGGSVKVIVAEDGFAVEDSGIGIAKEHIDRVFERFYRVDRSRSKATGGTGLGLAIVKHMAEKCGATVNLESKEGIGTKVAVKFKPDT